MAFVIDLLKTQLLFLTQVTKLLLPIQLCSQLLTFIIIKQSNQYLSSVEIFGASAKGNTPLKFLDFSLVILVKTCETLVSSPKDNLKKKSWFHIGKFYRKQIKKKNSILDTRISVLLQLWLLCNAHTTPSPGYDRVGLGSSGRRLISLNGKTKWISTFLFFSTLNLFLL